METTADKLNVARAAAVPALIGKHLYCYDGVCGICNATLRFFLKRDRRDVFRFAHLQGSFAQQELRARGVSSSELDAGLADSAEFRTFYLIANYGTAGERVYHRSRGTRLALILIGGVWGLLGRIGWIMPDFLFDWLYDGFSRVRYRLGKKHTACILPDEAERAKFVE